MPVTEIYLLRHGHRLAWTLDPTTGKYSSNVPFPTGMPADPPLASHGVRQAVETGEYLCGQLVDAARQRRLRVYSSPFYRCPETLRPTVERIRAESGTDLTVRLDRGVGEWFGKAWFEQPVPADLVKLRTFFPWIEEGYRSSVVPDRHGERIQELHDRIARALDSIVRQIEEEYASVGREKESVTLLICGHAAQIIATGRVLTGQMPEDPDEQDFKCFTCGISKFVRRRRGDDGSSDASQWRTNGGVAGGWDCELNSWCGHLSQGEERGWHFHGDESFDSYGAGSSAGPITYEGAFEQEKEAGAASESDSKL